MSETLLRVSGRGFVCGVVAVDGVVSECAPYLAAAARRSGWRGDKLVDLLAVARRSGWSAKVLS